MNFTRKRPREGRVDPPPAKRPDQRPQDRVAPPPPKAAPSAPPKTATPASTAPKVAAAKPAPPPPVPKAAPASEEQLKLTLNEAIIGQDLNLLLALIETVRSVSTEMVERAVSIGAEASKADEVIQEHGRQGFVAISQLRTLHRAVHHEVDQRKQQTTKFGDTDHDNAMQGVLSSEYELETFKALVEAQPPLSSAVGLLSEQDFQVASKGHPQHPRDGDTEHQRILKRIKFEEDQRKIAAAKLREIPLKQHTLKTSLNVEARELDSLKQKIRDFGSQINSLKNSLKLEDPTLQQTDPRSNFLPQPLYNLYIQLISWVSVFGNDTVEVSISGSLDVAKRAHSTASTSASASTSRKQLLPAEKAQQTHPLSVLCHFSTSPTNSSSSSGPSSASTSLGGRKIGFMFEYLTNLNLVIVTPLNNEDPRILANLFDGDSGETSPNWATQLLVAPSTPIMPRRARAYKWVQALCGLHFSPGPHETQQGDTPILASPDSLAPLAASLTDTMELLKRRVQMRHLTGAVWSSLVSGTIESEISYSSGAAQVASLRKWAELTEAQLNVLPKELQAYKKEHHLTVEIPLQAISTSRYFSAHFSTPGAGQTLQLVVEIPPGYPWSAPKFWFSESKAIPSEEIALMIKAFNAIDQTPSATHPERLVNHTLAWIRECINIYHSTLKGGALSAHMTSEMRYDPSTWTTS